MIRAILSLGLFGILAAAIYLVLLPYNGYRRVSAARRRAHRARTPVVVRPSNDVCAHTRTATGEIFVPDPTLI